MIFELTGRAAGVLGEVIRAVVYKPVQRDNIEYANYLAKQGFVKKTRRGYRIRIKGARAYHNHLAAMRPKENGENEHD